MSRTEPHDDREDRAQQSAHDRAEIKIKLIENGVLVKGGIEWFSFKTWDEASKHIGARLEKLKKTRADQAKKMQEAHG